jgi:hypothetical protein
MRRWYQFAKKTNVLPILKRPPPNFHRALEELQNIALRINYFQVDMLLEFATDPISVPEITKQERVPKKCYYAYQKIFQSYKK